MARPKFPRVDFYFEDWAHGTRGMPREEKGDYITLMCAIWDTPEWAIPYDVNWLRTILECRAADVHKRIDALVDRGKIYLGDDGKLHNGRADRDSKSLKNSARLAPTSAQVDANLAPSSPQLALNLKPNGAENEAKSTAAGTPHARGRARLPSPSPSKEDSLSQRASARGPSKNDLAAYRHALALLPALLVDGLAKIRLDRERPVNGDEGETLARALRKFPDPVTAAEEMVERGWMRIDAKWASQQRRLTKTKPAQHATSPPAGEDAKFLDKVIAEGRRKGGKRD